MTTLSFALLPIDIRREVFAYLEQRDAVHFVHTDKGTLEIRAELFRRFTQVVSRALQNSASSEISPRLAQHFREVTQVTVPGTALSRVLLERCPALQQLTITEAENTHFTSSLPVCTHIEALEIEGDGWQPLLDSSSLDLLRQLFPQVKKLSLKDMVFLPPEGDRSFAALEELSINESREGEPCEEKSLCFVQEFPRLRALSVDKVSGGMLRKAAPTLERLLITMGFSQIDFSQFPRLRSVTLYLTNDTVLQSLRKHASALEELSVWSTSLVEYDNFYNLHHDFPQLRTVGLPCIDEEIIDSLKHCAFLEQIKISIRWPAKMLSRQQCERLITTFPKQLQEVHIEEAEYGGVNPFLSAPQLQILRVERYRDVPNEIAVNRVSSSLEELSVPRLSIDELILLRDCPQLHGLRVTARQQLSEEWFEQVSQLGSLRKLYLEEIQNSGQEFIHLQQMPYLEECTLFDCPAITDDAIALLAPLPRLRALDMYWTPITGIGLRAFVSRVIPLSRLTLHVCNNLTMPGRLYAEQIRHAVYGYRGFWDFVSRAMYIFFGG